MNNSQQGMPMTHPRNSLMYLQNNPPPGTPGGIPAPGGAGSPSRQAAGRPPQRPGGRGGGHPASIDAQRASMGHLPAPDLGVLPGMGGGGQEPQIQGSFGAFNPYGGGGPGAPAAGGGAASAAFQYKCGDMVGKGAFGKVFQVTQCMPLFVVIPGSFLHI